MTSNWLRIHFKKHPWLCFVKQERNKLIQWRKERLTDSALAYIAFSLSTPFSSSVIVAHLHLKFLSDFHLLDLTNCHLPSIDSQLLVT